MTGSSKVEAVPFLTALFSGLSEGFAEVRAISRDGEQVHQKFIELGDIESLAACSAAKAQERDVYISVAPRVRDEGTGDAVERVQTIWGDADSDEAVAALEAFPLVPSIVVGSGSGSNQHCYFLLDEPVSPELAEDLNKRLAQRIGLDGRVTDRGRVLRVPGTLNHKHEPPAEVRLIECDPARRYSVKELEAELPAIISPASSAQKASQPTATGAVGRVLGKLDQIKETASGWTACCPAHDDTNPSLSIAEAEDGRCLVHCFAGCIPEEIVAALGLAMSDLFTDTARGRKASSRLVQLAESAGIEAFHSSQRVGHATITVDTHQETWPVRSEGLGLWLRRLQYAAAEEAVGDDVLSEAIATIEAKALFAGEEREVHRRVAGVDDRIVLDLGDEEWKAVEITAEGWEVVTDHDIRFVRDPSALALPTPEKGGSVEDLREFANCADEGSWMPLCGFLVMCLNPCGPYPLAYPTGEQGSAKSTVSRLVCSLVDPRVAPLMMGNPTIRDLAVIANSVWLVGFDNVSKVSPALSDALCQLATGGGYRTRQLYTDAEPFVLDLKRPVLLNGIGRVINRPDLLDRVALIELAPIPPERRRTEEELNTAWEKARPLIFGALLDGVSAALAESESVELEDFPRMADFARWVEAAGGAFGWTPGAFTASLEGSREELLEGSAEAHPEIEALLTFMEKREEWTGSATDLLKSLTAAADAAVTEGRDWPKRPDTLSNRLTQHAPLLRTHGLEVSRGREAGGKRKRFVRIKQTRDGGTRGDA